MSALDVIELENSGDILIVMEQMDTDLGRIIDSKNNTTSIHHQLFLYQVRDCCFFCSLFVFLIFFRFYED